MILYYCLERTGDIYMKVELNIKEIKSAKSGKVYENFVITANGRDYVIKPAFENDTLSLTSLVLKGGEK